MIFVASFIVAFVNMLFKPIIQGIKKDQEPVLQMADETTTESFLEEFISENQNEINELVNKNIAMLKAEYDKQLETNDSSENTKHFIRMCKRFVKTEMQTLMTKYVDTAERSGLFIGYNKENLIKDYEFLAYKIADIVINTQTLEDIPDEPDTTEFTTELISKLTSIGFTIRSTPEEDDIYDVDFIIENTELSAIVKFSEDIKNNEDRFLKETNKAVAYYACNFPIIITSQQITKNAIEAYKNKVILLTNITRLAEDLPEFVKYYESLAEEDDNDDDGWDGYNKRFMEKHGAVLDREIRENYDAINNAFEKIIQDSLNDPGKSFRAFNKLCRCKLQESFKLYNGTALEEHEMTMQSSFGVHVSNIFMSKILSPDNNETKIN